MLSVFPVIMGFTFLTFCFMQCGMSTFWICDYFLFELHMLFIFIIAAIQKFSSDVVPVCSTVLFDLGAAVYDVQRNMVFLKIYKINSSEAIFNHSSEIAIVESWQFRYVRWLCRRVCHPCENEFIIE